MRTRAFVHGLPYIYGLCGPLRSYNQASLSLLLTTGVGNIGRTVCVYRFRYREKEKDASDIGEKCASALLAVSSCQLYIYKQQLVLLWMLERFVHWLISRGLKQTWLLYPYPDLYPFPYPSALKWDALLIQTKHQLLKSSQTDLRLTMPVRMQQLVLRM
jgi:hypothetical protein